MKNKNMDGRKDLEVASDKEVVEAIKYIRFRNIVRKNVCEKGCKGGENCGRDFTNKGSCG